MKLIVGLGNPGKKYEKTRHNVGFETIDLLANGWGFDIDKEGFKGLFAKTKYLEKDLILLKPQTFMNLSGESVISIMNFYKIDIKDIIIIYDDMDIELGHVKLKENGSSGGHNGIKSIIQHLGTQEFKRIKVGIGHSNYDVIDYVLSKPSSEEQLKLDESMKNAVEAIKISIKDSFNKAMTMYNK